MNLEAERTEEAPWYTFKPTSLVTFVTVALAGLYGVAFLNVLPSYVSAWVLHLGLSARTAGAIATVNLLAYTAGLCATLYLVTRWPLPRIAYSGLIIAVVGDLTSILASDAWQLAVWRAVAGVGLGLLFGTVISWFGRNEDSARGFGTLALLQLILSAVFFFSIPRVESLLGATAVYVAVMPLALIAAICIFVLNVNGGSRPLARSAHLLEIRSAGTPRPFSLLRNSLAVFGLAVFEMAAMGLYAFMQEYGESIGLSRESASHSLALGSLAGIVGSLIVIVVGGRFGRLRPLVIAILLFAAPVAVFALTDTSRTAFVAGQLVIGLMWPIVLPYFQDLQSALDKSGRLCLLGMIVARLATASGPGAIGLIVGLGQFQKAFAIALLAFAASLLAVIYPARAMDRQVSGRGGGMPSDAR